MSNIHVNWKLIWLTSQHWFWQFNNNKKNKKLTEVKKAQKESGKHVNWIQLKVNKEAFVVQKKYQNMNN